MTTLIKYPIKNTFFRLGRDVPAVLYEPTERTAHSKIAIAIMHGFDYLSFAPAIELAKHGFLCLVSNPRNSEYPQQILDFQEVVQFLKKYPGVEKVILLGHSRGSSLLSAYQAIAENGVQIYQQDNRIYPFPDLPQLTPADGIMLLDTNYGIMCMLALDPAIDDSRGGLIRNPDLDPMNPANGYHPDGSHYPKEFVSRYLAAQRNRYNKLIQKAQERLALIETGHGKYLDDEPFELIGGNGSLLYTKLFSMDTSLLSHTRNPYPLIHADGSVTNEVIYSVRKAMDDKARMGTSSIVLHTTVREFLLSTVRLNEDFGYSADSFSGVDWESCFTCTMGNVKHISVPLLTMGMTGGYEFMAAEYNYENAKSKDKTIFFVEGATHEFFTNHAAEQYPGQYGDTLESACNFVSSWLLEKGRFL